MSRPADGLWMLLLSVALLFIAQVTYKKGTPGELKHTCKTNNLFPGSPLCPLLLAVHLRAAPARLHPAGPLPGKVRGSEFWGDSQKRRYPSSFEKRWRLRLVWPPIVSPSASLPFTPKWEGEGETDSSAFWSRLSNAWVPNCLSLSLYANRG